MFKKIRKIQIIIGAVFIILYTFSSFLSNADKELYFLHYNLDVPGGLFLFFLFIFVLSLEIAAVISKKKAGLSNRKSIIIFLTFFLFAIYVIIASFPGCCAVSRDSRIVSSLGQARNVMVLNYEQEGNYDNFNCEHEDMAELCEIIDGYYSSSESRPPLFSIRPEKAFLPDGREPIVAHDALSNSQTVCIYSPLNAKDNYWYCADSSGRAGFTEIDPGGEGFCQDGASAVCPLEGEIGENDFTDSTEYVSHVIIEGDWGNGPGQFGMTLFEGAPFIPKSLVVDSQGIIFILDSINSRIQKFNQQGKYLASIPLEKYQRIRDTAGYEFMSVYVSRILIDSMDNLYWRQENRSQAREVVNKFFKLSKSGQLVEITRPEFEMIENRALFKMVFVKLDNKEYTIQVALEKEDDHQIITITDIGLATGAKVVTFHLKYPSATSIDFIRADSNGNFYVFTSWPPQIYKYSIEGNLLSVIDLEGLPNPYGEHFTLNSLPFVDSKGNIYQAELIPNPDKKIEHFPAYSLGLKVIKWENREE